MTTEAQIVANRNNALASTGPKTPGGRAISSKNAVRHGIFAFSLLPQESEADLEAFLGRYRQFFQADGPLEEDLVDQFVFTLWRQRRLQRLEAGIFRAQVEGMVPRDIPYATMQGEMLKRTSEEGATEDRELRDQLDIANAVAFVMDSRGPNAFLKLSRYEGALSRGAMRVLHELQRLQAARKAGVPVQPPAALDLDVSVQHGGQAPKYVNLSLPSSRPG